MTAGVTVIVPTCRRPALLRRCLAALIAQEYDPGRYEIVVSDDAPGTGALPVVRAMAHGARVKVHYLAVSGTRGPAGARNAGAACAAYEVLAFTDDDCAPRPGWLAAGVASLEAGAAGAATGRVVVPIGRRPTDYERNEAGLSGSEFVTANLFCLRRVFIEAGGFDSSFTMAWREDSDLQFRLLARGIPIVRAPEALVVHPVRPARWGVSLLQQRKSMFDALLYKKHPALYRERIAATPPLHYYAIAASLISGTLALVSAGWQAAVPLLWIWAALTARFFLVRMRGASRALRHVAEMAVTSVLIPFLSIYWRIYGAWTFRVAFL